MLRFYIIPLFMLWFTMPFGFAANQTDNTVVINEILASNHSGALDPDFSQFADWIELYNNSAADIDLSGWTLTDDFSEPEKWHIPENIILPAHGYLLIWADGTGLGLHSNFKLDNAGEVVGLYAPDGTAMDTLSFGEQVSDVSFGRSPVDLNVLLYFENPTPDGENSTEGVETSLQSAQVEINKPSGFYTGAIDVTLSTVNGTIRYTTDGSTPNRFSPEYHTPLKISSTTVLKTGSFAPNLLPGPVETRTLFINEDVHLPVFSLTTEPDFLWDPDIGIYVDENISARKSWERPATLEFFDANGYLAFSRQADIRLFGRTAIYIPQKSLSIFLRDRLNYPLFPDMELHEFDAFLLRSSSDDWHQTMFRDGFIQKWVQDHMNVDTQAYRPAVLFINGAYWGIHNIREKYNESYVETHDGVDRDNVDILYIDERNEDVEVVAGDRAHYDALIDFISTHDVSLEENYDVVASLVDIDNLIDYVIAQAHIGNRSWAHNIRAWRPRTTDGKWRWMIFDLDRGFRYASYNSLEEMANRFHPFSELLTNDIFKNRFIGRFVEYMNDSFSPARVVPLLDSLRSVIAPEMPNHIQRWDGFCGNNVCGISSMELWQDYVAEMRNIVGMRPATVRQQLIDLFDLDSVVQLDLQVQQPGYGYIELGQQTTIRHDYSGQFFQNTIVPLKAGANDGFYFVGWRQSAQRSQIVLPRESLWTFFDKGYSPGVDWMNAGFDDSGWASGPAELGYGDGDERTVVDYGPDSGDKYVTTYFRSSFQISEISAVEQLIFKLKRDDGALVYLNGQEVLRSNMPGGEIQYDTRANDSTGDEDAFFEFFVNPGGLVVGENVVAVEVHQRSASSSDISFDLEIEAVTSSGTGGIISENPELRLELDSSQALTAVFASDSGNELPAQIFQNITLTAAQSPYLALQDVIVSPNVTLRLAPGAQIRFADGASLIVNGQVVANGSEEQPVVLRGIGDNRWGALCIENATAASTLSHVNIKGATTGPDAAHFKAAVTTRDSDVTLDYVRIENVDQPFYANGGTIIITNSTLDGLNSGDDIANIQYASARVENCLLVGNGELDFDAVDNGVIRNNRIKIISSNSNRDGIDIGASDHVLIENNRIFDCPDKGISVGEGSKDAIIRGNLVVNTSMGVAVKDDSYAFIDRTTFYNDSLGVACYEKVAGQGGGHAVVTNSIFAGQFTAEYSIDAKSSIDITYSLSERALVDGTGNIQGNPHFVDPGSENFHLLTESPCIDAGDPTALKDPDGSRADIGAYFYNKGPISTTGLVINEFMADNSQTIADELGQFDDWIEIYNGSDAAINIAGLYLTDNFAEPAKWRIPDYQPELTTLAPGGFLLIWADEDAYQGMLHANFKLDATGEQLALAKKSGNHIEFVDSLSFSAQQPDASTGRSYDGATFWRSINPATPGRTNDPLHTDSSKNSKKIPQEFMVHQNYPNPFNPKTEIVYELPKASNVDVEIFNSLGQRISVLLHEAQEAGVHRITWSALDAAGHQVSSGLYFYKVTAGEFSAVRKMVLMR